MKFLWQPMRKKGNMYMTYLKELLKTIFVSLFKTICVNFNQLKLMNFCSQSLRRIRCGRGRRG